MSRQRVVRAVAAAAATASGAFALLGGGRALGVSGPQTAELGTGGTVRGDISTEAGDADLVGIDLSVLSRLDASLTSEFFGTLELLGPDDVVLATAGPGYSPELLDRRIVQAGRYHLRIASADGSQGLYKLRAVERWPTKVVQGTCRDPALRFHVPAGGSVTASVTVKPRTSWTPQIAALTAPDRTQLLPAPIVGDKGVVRLPATVVPAEGMYELDVGGGAPGARFRAAVTVKGPKVATTTVDLRNGLTPVPPVSFAADGVGSVFRYECSWCHGWAASYGGVSSHATVALAYIRSGAMPRGLPRLSAQDVALIQSWISTGKKP